MAFISGIPAGRDAHLRPLTAATSSPARPRRRLARTGRAARRQDHPTLTCRGRRPACRGPARDEQPPNPRRHLHRCRARAPEHTSGGDGKEGGGEGARLWRLGLPPGRLGGDDAGGVSSEFSTRYGLFPSLILLFNVVCHFASVRSYI